MSSGFRLTYLACVLESCLVESRLEFAMYCARLCLLPCALFAIAVPLLAKDKPQGVDVGDAAPKFVAHDDQGGEWKSEEHFSKGIVVVYFYPADCTGGCTKQAKAYTDSSKKLADLGVTVVGVSGDSVDNHKLFKKKEALNITLLADESGEVAEAFGVPVTKGEKTAKTQIDGQDVSLIRQATASRWTFVVKDGKIVHKNTQVKAAEDAAAVIEVVQGLK